MDIKNAYRLKDLTLKELIYKRVCLPFDASVSESTVLTLLKYVDDNLPELQDMPVRGFFFLGDKSKTYAFPVFNSRFRLFLSTFLDGQSSDFETAARKLQSFVRKHIGIFSWIVRSRVVTPDIVLGLFKVFFLENNRHKLPHDVYKVLDIFAFIFWVWGLTYANISKEILFDLLTMKSNKAFTGKMFKLYNQGAWGIKYYE